MKNYVFAAAAVSVVLGGSLLLIYLVTAPAKAAAANLQAINSITVGETTEADLLRRAAFQTVDRQCFAADCLYHMEAENAFLSAIHLARRTHLSTVVKVRDGVVTGVSVIEWRAGMPQLWLNQMSELKDCDVAPCIKQLVTPDKTVHGIRITFDGRSTIRNRMPQAVDSTCLSRLRGCETDVELMPVLREIGASAKLR